jgi:hypothetical protein
VIGSLSPVLAAADTSGTPYIAIAVPILVAVVVAFWAARRSRQR